MVARFIWNIIFITFGIQPPSGVSNMLVLGSMGFLPSLKIQILVGATALCWAIWLSRNDVSFNRTTINSFMQVIFRKHVG